MIHYYTFFPSPGTTGLSMDATRRSLSFLGMLLMAISLRRASFLVSIRSQYTIESGRRPEVYFAPLPLLWASSRAERSTVQPV